MDDIVFDFDASGLVGKIMRVQIGFDKMWDSVDNSVGVDTMKKTQKEIKNTSKEVENLGSTGQISLASLAKGAAIAGAGFLAIKGLLSSFPEFGDTLFSFGEILKYNLLSPIRDELIPVLNSILAWASQNEKVFTRIGIIIATAFKIGIQIVKSFFGLIKTLFNSIFGRIEDLTGKTIGSAENAINLISTKIAATLNFIFITAEPVFSKIGSLIGSLLVGFKEFFGGVLSGFGDIATAMPNIINLFQTLFGWLTKTNEESSTISGIWSGIGKVIGTTLRMVVKLLDTAVGLVIMLGKGLGKVIGGTINLFDTEKTREAANKQREQILNRQTEFNNQKYFNNSNTNNNNYNSTVNKNSVYNSHINNQNTSNIKNQKVSNINNDNRSINNVNNNSINNIRNERIPLQPVNNVNSHKTENNMNANANVYVTNNIYNGGEEKADQIVDKTKRSLKDQLLGMFSETLEATGQ